MRSPEKFVIYGAGGHAKVVADVICTSGTGKVVGFVDDSQADNEFLGVPVVTGDEAAAFCEAHSVGSAVVAVGDAKARNMLAERLMGLGLALPVLVHPGAVVAGDVVLGDGTVVMAGAVINPGSRTGRLCIVNTGATLDHDCLLEDLVQLAPGVHTGGDVYVGEGAFVGIGASVRNGVRIGQWSVVGMGANVVKDIPDNVVVVGNPAKEREITGT